MPYQLWSQDNFTKGELSPYMYARAGVNQYYEGLKVAQNVLNYPTGAAGKRFGTLYQSTLNAAITSFNQIFFQTFQYFDQCVYQLVFYPNNIDIYLEGIFVANVSTSLDAQSVYNLSSTILDGAFRVSGQGFKPYDLTRSANSPLTITSVTGNAFGLSGGTVTTGQVTPVTFSNSGGTLPTTSPQIKAGIVYFAMAIGTAQVRIYSTAYNAKFDIDRYTLTNTGTGTNSLIIQNTWTFAHSVFKNLPVYDFNGNYDAINFTVGTPSAGSVTITLSAPLANLTSGTFVGGAFFGAGGAGRITAVADTSHFTVYMVTPFTAGTVIPGTLALLAEPAWSDARGWPQKCSSYQNRAIFCNSDSLPNGFWASVTNDYTDFGDLTNDDDDAISWYPSSNDVNVIRFIVPYRSITVHTNSGIYSSPLSEVTAITPSTFSLQLQDSTPADVLQPQSIDNQIIVLSGNDVHTMLWDGINNAYTSNIVSVINEQTIRDPVDETSYADLRRAGSRYVFIINANGSMAIYQTLQSENVAGFTPAILEQSYGSAQFLQCASSFDGRAWFVNQRQIAVGGSSHAITANTSNTLTTSGIQSLFNPTGATAITFTVGGGGVLPTAQPPIDAGVYYWGVATGANTYQVFTTQEDAIAGTNPLTFSDHGTSAFVVPWPLGTIFTLEELTQDTFIDCAMFFNNNGSPLTSIPTGNLFNAQQVVMLGDGFAFNAEGAGNSVDFEAHGEPVAVNQGYIGFPINLIIEPMPLTPPPGQQTTLTKPIHVRSIRFMFNNTIGGTINGVPIALEPFDMADIGEPPFPATGFVEQMTLSGWDNFNQPAFTIEHSDPFDIQLLGIFYSVDT